MDIRETSIDKIQGESIVTVYTTENKYVNKLNKLHMDYPDLVQLKEVEDGIIAKVPSDWFKFVSPKRSANASEEQKQKMKERMAKARESRKKAE